ncbi:hypothetical protein PGTUg99_035865 [Puccinia graminis f. sp. tritici]|uniref:Mob1/phocein n=1 Tax=Puccinia graminis f. sp. tritici TaxID=56615 RepID=A0A5B0RRC3_PUCGR|nr:hypothetical protein PGTUg99_035865 [Puccinia graminis f. sp. tritici]
MTNNPPEEASNSSPSDSSISSPSPPANSERPAHTTGDGQDSSHPANDCRAPIRLRKGTRYEDVYPSTLASSENNHGPSSSLHLASPESPFQLQEYIADLVRADPHAVDRIISPPSPLIPREVWVYEQLRRIALDLSYPLVCALQADCNRDKCPEMKAGEWLYLCAAHATANENQCCAIDYIVHTLDGATALLNSARYFPSRLQIPSSSNKHFTSIARRLYRILAHAWFHHRELFEECEMETSLYARFMGLTDQFELIPEDLLVIPRGIEGESDRHDEEDESPQDDGSEERVEETLPTTPDDQLQQGSLDQQQQHLAPNPIVDLLLRASDNPAILDSLVDKPELENGHVELSTT